MAQMDPEPALDNRLVDRVIAYLQTRNTDLFPFTTGFDEQREHAFVRDLRMGLSDLTESGAKRGTSASGFLVSDRLLREVIGNWADANGGWPSGSNPADATSPLSALRNVSGT